jgi:hypothetical protein
VDPAPPSKPEPAGPPTSGAPASDEVAALVEELARVRQERDDLRADAAAGRDALRTLAAQHTEAAELADLLRQARKERDDAREELAALVTSTSWRVTGPLRRASERRRARQDRP